MHKRPLRSWLCFSIFICWNNVKKHFSTTGLAFHFKECIVVVGWGVVGAGWWGYTIVFARKFSIYFIISLTIYLLFILNMPLEMVYFSKQLDAKLKAVSAEVLWSCRLLDIINICSYPWTRRGVDIWISEFILSEYQKNKSQNRNIGFENRLSIICKIPDSGMCLNI